RRGDPNLRGASSRARGWLGVDRSAVGHLAGGVPGPCGLLVRPGRPEDRPLGRLLSTRPGQPRPTPDHDAAGASAAGTCATGTGTSASITWRTHTSSSAPTICGLPSVLPEGIGTSTVRVAGLSTVPG